MKISNLSVAVSALGLVGLLAGAGVTQAAPSQPPAAAPAPQAPRTAMATCPMAVPGTQVTVSDTRGGVALTFTTRTGDVRDLRHRVQTLAHHYEMHPQGGMMQWQNMHGGMGQSHGMGMGHGRGQGMGQGQGMGMGAGPMPRVHATVEDLPGGARVILTPVDPSDLAALRTRVHLHAQRMQSGQCWMRRSH